MKQTISTTIHHKVPNDMRDMLLSTPHAHATWEDISPIARNEWVCWVTSAKKDETRDKRRERAQEDLIKGKRRPCCWAGCPHREK